MRLFRFILSSLVLFSAKSLNFNLSRRKITGVSVASVFGNKLFEINENDDVKNEANKLDIWMDDVEIDEQEPNKSIIKLNDNIIRFYGPITRISCLRLQYMLNELEDSKEIKTIHLHIQSTGGELMSAFFVSDYIKCMKTPVYTYVDSFAASAATILTIVGKKRFMSEHSLILIHQLSTEISGKYNELNIELENLDTIMGLAKDIYLKNSKLNPEALDELLATNLWLNSTIALKLGIIDETI